jgi:hypothetical protein
MLADITLTHPHHPMLVDKAPQLALWPQVKPLSQHQHRWELSVCALMSGASGGWSSWGLGPGIDCVASPCSGSCCCSCCSCCCCCCRCCCLCSQACPQLLQQGQVMLDAVRALQQQQHLHTPPAAATFRDRYGVTS